MKLPFALIVLFIGTASCAEMDEPARPVPSERTSNSLPVITNTLISGRESEPLSGALGMTDADGDEISVHLIDAPDWLSISQAGRLSGTPPAEAIGETTFQLSMSDGFGTVTTAFTLQISYHPLEQALRTGDYT
ncbi:MAG: Ig-like domain-containing protein, partial [Pseudomonadota bacterium]